MFVNVVVHVSKKQKTMDRIIMAVGILIPINLAFAVFTRAALAFNIFP
ncbi:hypothetical protein CCP3SC1_180004 [Gammaproteobacteria bacterium]